jgi:hypothetical protein
VTETLETLAGRLREHVGTPFAQAVTGPDPVNAPMIRHLCEALGDRNPVYTDEAFAAASVHGGIVAPPTSLQIWTMRGPGQPGDLAQHPAMHMLQDEGYTGVVATDCEQIYHRYLRPGDRITVTTILEDVAGPKRTALGEGFFVTTLRECRDQHGELVGEMRFRVLKFRPLERKPVSDKPPPPIDSAFFWEGVDHGELRIQRCAACGTLRHPPRPVCPSCGSFEREFVVASGRGTVYSYVVHHHPAVPGREHPFAVALVELEEGTRIVGNVVGCDPADVHVGMPVALTFTTEGRKLPQWRPQV